jgi:hypothetical protein
MKPASVPLALLVATVGMTSCTRCSPPAPAEDSAPQAASSTSAADAAPPGRCALVGSPQVVGALAGEDAAAAEGPVAYGAEIGGAVADAKGFVVGIRSAGLRGEGQVWEISSEGAARLLATLPTTIGGARAPLLATTPSGARLVGTLSIEDKSRTFHLARLAEGGALAPLGDVTQGKDESEATVFLGTAKAPLVAWDDADDKLGVGRVRARLLGETKEPKEPKETKAATKDAGAQDDDVASPSTSDAAWPELVISPKGDRAALIWLSERPESEAADGGEGEPSQALAYRWVEAVVIDLASGARLGAARALTPLEGHAQTFAASWGDAGLVLAVRDDARPTDGDGGELWAVRVPVDGAGVLGEATRLSLADKDVAPGVAALLPRPGGALVAWLGQDGTTHLSPAFTPGAATIEPALQERRILASRDDRALASRLVGSGVELAVIRCGR